MRFISEWNTKTGFHILLELRIQNLTLLAQGDIL